MRLNRRRLLSYGCGLACGTVWSSSRREVNLAAEVEGPYIDAHSHIWTRDVERYPLKKGATVEDLAPGSFTAAELMATARPLGVSRVVLIAHTQYYGFDNRYLIDAAKAHPGVFRVVGMVDDREPHPDHRMRQLHEAHVTGFRITPSIRGKSKWLDNDGMRAMWSCAADTGQAMCCLINPDDLPQVDRMCDRFRGTNVVIDHFARIGSDGEIRRADLDALCRLARFPQVHVKVSAFYALGRKRPPYDDLVPMIRRIYEAFGPQRMMWASDSPYQIDAVNSYHESLELIRNRVVFLTEADRRWLLRGTAEKVYFYQ